MSRGQRGCRQPEADVLRVKLWIDNSQGAVCMGRGERGVACNQEEGLGGVKRHLGQVIISSALVLAEPVQDAACGVCVEEG